MPALFHNPPCPWLPSVAEIHDHRITRRHGTVRDAAFHRDALRYSQSLWLAGKPAQAILQLDKAWMADLDGTAPPAPSETCPYHALAWIIRRAASGNCGYLGNPVRHFQHLASRMSGPRAEIRTWRAWFCMHLAEHVLPRPGYPRDGRQIVREGLWIPSVGLAIAALSALGGTGEALAARSAMDALDPLMPENSQLPPPSEVSHA